jgi:hypothetical protein
VAQDLAEAFRAALGLVSIFVTVAAGRIKLGRGADPAAALKRLRKADPDAELLVVGWCRSDRAELLMMALRGDEPGCGLPLPADAGEMVRMIGMPWNFTNGSPPVHLSQSSKTCSCVADGPATLEALLPAVNQSC